MLLLLPLHVPRPIQTVLVPRFFTYGFRRRSLILIIGNFGWRMQLRFSVDTPGRNGLVGRSAVACSAAARCPMTMGVECSRSTDARRGGASEEICARVCLAGAAGRSREELMNVMTCLPLSHVAQLIRSRLRKYGF